MSSTVDKTEIKPLRGRTLKTVAKVILALAALAALVGALWIGISAGRGLYLRAGSLDAPAVILDEAFVFARPGLSAGLAELGSRPLAKTRYSVPPLSAGQGALLAAAATSGFVPKGQSAPKGSPKAAGIVTSPLYAQALADAADRARQAGLTGQEGSNGQPAGFDALGGARVAVPEWPGKPRAGIATAITDWKPAYRAAGKAAGDWIGALEKANAGSAGVKAAILFRERPSAGTDCLAAFREGYAASGRGDEAVEEILPAGAGEGDTEAALSRLLASDIRLVLVALGPGSRDAALRLARPGIAVGLESAERREGESFAFALIPDEEAILKALWRLASGKEASDRIEVQARLIKGRGAESFKAGAENLAAQLGRKGS